MSRIIQLTAENVKRLQAIKITPQGNVVVIGGDNGQGKTSVLDCIAMALGGTNEVPAMPVRKGSEKAVVIATLDNGLTIKRTFTKTGGTNLIVESKDGARYPSPQAMLDGLTGKLMFDPLAFNRMDEKKQAAALKALLGLDFTALDAKRNGIYEERTILNRDLARTRLLAEQLPSYPEAPKESVDTAVLVDELGMAKTHNSQQFKLETEFEEATDALAHKEQVAEMIRANIADTEKRLAQARIDLENQLKGVEESKTLVQKTKAAFVDFKPIDVAPITTKLAGAAVTNKQVQANVIKDDATKALREKDSKVQALTKAIETIDATKEAEIAKAPFPIAGLGFDANGVTFNGIPFNQASGAEQLRISVAMGAALNPKLRVMLVRDGSLLDENSMILLADLAQQHDLQVFIERVGKGDVSAIIIEDGHVAGADAPATEPAQEEFAATTN